MLQTLTDALCAEGLEWKLSSLECMTAGSQHDLQDGIDIAVGGLPIHVPRKERLTCLGTKIRFDGDTMASMRWRIHIAFKTFHRMKDLFCSRMRPLKQRLLEYSRRIVPCILHCSHGWTWTRTTVRALRRYELMFLRKIIHHAPRKDEPWLEWNLRVIRGCRRLLRQHGFEPIELRWLRRIHKWAGEIQPARKRLKPCGFGALTSKIMKWKSTPWWNDTHARMIRVDPLNKMDWKHPARGRIRQRWDSVLQYFTSDCRKDGKIDWHEAASNHTWPNTFLRFAIAAFDFIGLALPFLTCNNEQLGKTAAEQKDEEEENMLCESCPPLPLEWNLDNWIGRTSASSKQIVIAMQIQGDTLSTIQWLNGLWYPQSTAHSKQVLRMQNILSWLWRQELLQPRVPWANFFRWAPRRYNCHADALSKYAMSLHNDAEEIAFFPCSDVVALDGYFDGSYKNGKVGMGFAVWARTQHHENWQVLMTYAAASNGSSAMDSEILAALCLVQGSLQWFWDDLDLSSPRILPRAQTNMVNFIGYTAGQ